MLEQTWEFIRQEALRFKREAQGTSPRIISGHKVAHDPEDKSRVLNFSTITRVVTAPCGLQIFLIYRYPLSWIHSVTDNLQRWGSGRPSTKPFRRSSWQKSFVPKSRIEIYKTNVPGVVAMPYVPNYNLHDILYHGIGDFKLPELTPVLTKLCNQINAMHRSGTAWGELIVHNIIVRKPDLEPVICDTEVTYWPWIPHEEQCMHDWRDFIFSVCGANRSFPVPPEALARLLFQGIRDTKARILLQRYCLKQKSLGQTIFWQGFAGSLSLPSVESFERIKRAIAHTA